MQRVKAKLLLLILLALRSHVQVQGAPLLREAKLVALLHRQISARVPAKAIGNRDLSIRIEDAGASGSSPYIGVDVLVRARDQSWRQRTDNKGAVNFTAIPCGGTVSIKLLNAEQPFRTLAFPCQQTPLDISAFVVNLCPSSLQLIAKQTNLTVPLSGVVTQHILFKRGAIATVINDAISGGGIHNYLLTAKKGQEISIHMVPLEEQNPVLFDVYYLRDPGVYMKALGAKAGCIANENVKDFKGILPMSGDYVVSVYTDGSNGKYSMDVIIQ